MVSTISKSCNKYLATLAAVALMTGLSASGAAAATCAPAGSIVIGPTPACEDVFVVGPSTSGSTSTQTTLSPEMQTYVDAVTGNGSGQTTAQAAGQTWTYDATKNLNGLDLVNSTSVSTSTITQPIMSSVDTQLKAQLTSKQTELFTLADTYQAEYTEMQQLISSGCNYEYFSSCYTTADLNALTATYEANKANLQNQISSISQKVAQSSMTAFNGALNDMASTASGYLSDATSGVVSGITSSIDTSQLEGSLGDLQSQLTSLEAQQFLDYNNLKQQVANSAADLAAGKCAPAGSIVVGPTPACPTVADLAALVKSQDAAKALLQGQISTVQNQINSAIGNAQTAVVNLATNSATQMLNQAGLSQSAIQSSIDNLFCAKSGYISELGASACGNISPAAMLSGSFDINKLLNSLTSSALSSAQSSISSAVSGGFSF